jgi:uncharacterized protein YprB with RNaseH-like and TPR domain
MSSWSSKLARVSLPPAKEVVLPLAAAEARNVGAPELPSDPRLRLEALRARIANLLSKSAPSAARIAVADPCFGELPFAREETSSGPLYVRRRRLGWGHRVGRAAVHAGASASSAMLALLALDPGLAEVDPRAALYIDTETTGLAGGAGTIPFLIGLAWYEMDSATLVIEQLLLRELGEEAPMLERLAERARRASMWISYNGKSFDLPRLRARLVLERLPALEQLPHLDLVHVARRVHRHRLAQLTLARVESEVLGFERVGDISGGDVCARYTHFLRTGDDSALAAVVDHNEWDVVSMAALVGLYGEPLDGLSPADWSGVARTLRRAGSLELAHEFAHRAVLQGGGFDALRARGEIAKARGDKAQALADYASLVATVDDPALRLELAKLYEHHAKAPLAALELVRCGTGERVDAQQRRVRRLEKKRDRGR